MTHSPTPDETAEERLCDAATLGDQRYTLSESEFDRLIAQVKADAVAQYKAQEIETQVEELGSYLYQTEVPNDSVWDATREGARNRARRYLKVARRER